MIFQVVIFILLLILAVFIPLEHIFGKRKKVINSSNTLSIVTALFLINIITTTGNNYDSKVFLGITLMLIIISFLGSGIRKFYSGIEFNIPDFENISVEKVFQKGLYHLRFPEFSREVIQENRKVKYSFKPEKYIVEFNTKKFFFESGYYHNLIFKNAIPKEMKYNLLEYMDDFLKQQGEPVVKWRTRIIEAAIVFVIVVGAMVFLNFSVLHPKQIEQIYDKIPDTLMVDKYDSRTQKIESVEIKDPDVISAILMPVENAYAYYMSNTYLDKSKTEFTYRISIPDNPFELYYKSSRINLHYNYQTLVRADSPWLKIMVYFSHIYSQKDGAYYYLINEDFDAGVDAEHILSQYFN